MTLEQDVFKKKQASFNIEKSKNTKTYKIKTPNAIDLGYIPFIRPHLFVDVTTKK